MSAGAVCGLEGCAEMVPPGMPLLIDQITTQRSANGVECVVDFRKRDAIDAMGRHAYVTGITMRGTYRVTTGASNDAIPARELLGLMRDIYLEDFTGHQYAAALEGRNARDDQFFRVRGVDVWTNAGDALGANVGAQNNDLEFVWHWPFVRNVARPGADLAGAIPLAALQKHESGALRFTMASTLNEAEGDAYDGVTFAGFIDTVRVWVHVAWSEAEIAPPKWQVRDWTSAELGGIIEHPERMTEYCVVRHRIDDDGGESIADYGTINVQRGSSYLIQGLSLAQLIERDLWLLTGFDPRSDFNDTGEARLNSLPYIGSTLGAGFDIEPSSVNALLLVPSVPHFRAMLSGRTTWNFDSRTRDRTRFLQRTWLCNDDKARATLEALRCGAANDVNGLSAEGNRTSPSRIGSLISKRQSSRQR